MRSQEVVERLLKAIFNEVNEEQLMYEEMVKKRFAKSKCCVIEDLEIIDFILSDEDLEWGILFDNYCYKVITDLKGNIITIGNGTIYE